MFTREEMGRMFHFGETVSTGASSSVQAQTQTNSKATVPKRALQPEDMVLGFKPSMPQFERRTHWPGRHNELQPAAEEDDDDFLTAARQQQLRAAAAPTTSSDATGHKRQRVEAEVVEEAMEIQDVAAEQAAPRRRVVVAAEVVEADEQVDMDGAGGEEAPADEDEERRRRVRQRLAAQREAPDAMPDLSSLEDISSRVAAALEAQGKRAVAQPAHAASLAGPSALQEQAGVAGDQEEDIAARRARIRARAAAREPEPSHHPPVPTMLPPSHVGPQAHAPEGVAASIVSADGLTVRLRGARQHVEAEVVQDEEEEAVQEQPSALPSAAGAARAAAGTHVSGETADEWSAQKPMFRPIFKPREARKTLQEAAAAAEAEESARAAASTVAARRAEESRAMVVDALRAAPAGGEEAGEEVEGAQGKPDDTDRIEDEEREYEAWKLRELRRLARDALAAETALREASETARRRTLTPEERAKEDALLEAQGLKVFRKTKEKWGFLQKYYHKGAFFMDESSVVDKTSDPRARSAAAPTGEDAIAKDKAALPKVMQVKNFGRKGRTRWTHLAAEDTTVYDDYHKDVARAAHGYASGARR